ncbi:MAG: hypothetical protein ACYCZX_03950 [Rhodospirillaceae bacterium]
MVLLTVLGEADGLPISLGRNYFPLSRRPILETESVDADAGKRPVTYARTAFRADL